MRAHRRYCLSICFSFLFCTVNAQNCRQLITKADSLFKLHQNEEALNLVQRVSYFKCDGDYKGLLANLYFETGDYYSALQYYETELQAASPSEKKQAASIGIIKSYLKLELFNRAIASLNTAYKSTNDSLYKRRLRLYYFLTYWKSGNVDSAELWSLACVGPDSVKQKLAKTYFSDFKHKHKRPNLAMLMNLLLPGSGFIYTKNYERATKSIVLNTVFAVSTIYTAGQYYPAYALVAVGSWWIRYYAGGLVNGYNSAIYYNRNQRDIWKEKILALMEKPIN